MIRKISTLIIAFVWAVGAIASTPPDDKPENVLPVQEKVYLHLDNNCYFLGDTIWYKAYVVLADVNSPQPLSRVLYVELLDEQGYLRERQQLYLDLNGQANGQFAICDTLFSGYYEIRAYTKWMLNFGYKPLPSWHSNSWAVRKDNTETESYEPFLRDVPTGEIEKIITSGEQSTYESQKVGDEQKYKFVSHIDNEFETISVLENGMQRNYRDYLNLFSRVVPVYNRPDSVENYLRKIMPTKITMGDYEVKWKTPEFDVKFYPEGGYLLEGHECRVAWEAFNQELERLNVSGILLEDGDAIDTIRPYHGGRGFFSFTPKHGNKYKVRFTFGEHKFTFDLPDALKEGARLVCEQDEEAIYFDVESQLTTPRQLTLSIYCRGKKIKTFPIDGEGKWEKGYYLDDLPEGVNQAVITDEIGNIYADRLFFVNKNYESVGKILVDGIANRAYQPLEKISLSIMATDAKGRPLKDQTISVAVRDADQLDPTFATGNIMTNLLLESEIKGFVENPDYYFESNDEKHRTALDLLLMIQGWRRYDWHYVDHPETFTIDYLPEQQLVISGQAFRLRKALFSKDEGQLQISCSLRNMDPNLKGDDVFKFRGVTIADSLGHFSFAYDPFYGDYATLTLRAKFVKKKEKKNYDLISNDKRIFIIKNYFYPQSLKEYSWYENHTPEISKDKKLTWEEFQQDIYASEWIPQVNIKSKKRPHAKRQPDKPVYSIDFLDMMNDIWDQGFYQRFDLFDNQNYDFNFYYPFIFRYFRHQYTTSPNNSEAIIPSINFKVNNLGLKMSQNSFLPILKRVDVVSDAPLRPTSFEHYHLDRRSAGNTTFGVDTYLNIVTNSNDSTQRTLGREYKFPGFNKPIESYNPDYSKASLPQVKDYRRTLYWNPNLTTNNYGRAIIEFYNNSVCKLLDISSEGISKHGEFLIGEQ